MNIERVVTFFQGQGWPVSPPDSESGRSITTPLGTQLYVRSRGGHVQVWVEGKRLVRIEDTDGLLELLWKYTDWKIGGANATD